MKEGRAYFIAVDEKDDEFFRICFPNFWSIEDEEERRDVLVACDHANALCKVAKVFTVRDNTWASIEIFVNDVRDFEPIFERSMSALMTSVHAFVEKMRELR